MIQIMKASAGSGKTYSLAEKYIELLLNADDTYAYRHILAVTFTNKATAEMKGRILKELHILAIDPLRSPYYKDLQSNFKSAEELKQRSYVLLCNILHDYSAFAVSTIDRFFQQALKAFSREIGQFASYQVELDKDSLVKESVDRILDNLTEKDTQMLKWLTDSAMEAIELGNGYNLVANLQDVAQRLKSEEYRNKVEEHSVNEQELYKDSSLKELRKVCDDIIDDFAAKVELQTKVIFDAFAKAGVNPDHTNRKFMSKLKVYLSSSEQYDKNAISLQTDTFYKNYKDPEKWFAKKNASMAAAVEGIVDGPVIELVDLFDTRFKIYKTAVALKHQILGFGIAGRLYKEFDEILKEKNVLSIDDSNTILKGIIDGTDTPFIYEKLGVRYEHFLLDEFQDTAHVQWDNFRPLLKESIDNGFYNLIVGDVKQSIYRWRNSDWKLLDSEIQNSFDKEQVNEKTLQSNYRSERNIVEYNNDFFKYTSKFLDDYYYIKTGLERGSEVLAPALRKPIPDIYADVEQLVSSKSENPGYVKFTLCPAATKSKDNIANQTAAVVDTVKKVIADGCRYRDIAILVRGASEGSAIASALISAGINVVTDDSLKISASVIVRRLVALLTNMDNPQDKIADYFRRQLDLPLPESYHSLVDLCESLLRSLKSKTPEDFAGEILYIQSFMDLLRDFVGREGNNLHKFLEFWKDDTSSISSPSLSDSVRIMTVHKSKGLDFNCVIVPFLDKVNLFKSDKSWCHPDITGTDLENVAGGVYDINLSEDTANTLFEREYYNELRLQYIDNLNIMYVALTRAVHGMHLIFPEPSKKFMDTLAKKISSVNEEAGMNDNLKDLTVTSFANILYLYLMSRGISLLPEHYLGQDQSEVAQMKSASKGEVAWQDFERKIEPSVKEVASTYESYPLNPAQPVVDPELFEPNPIQVNGRLKFSTSSIDFFGEDGTVGVEASHRLRGILLHDILSNVKVPADLDAAVDKFVKSGELPAEEAEDTRKALAAAIASVADRGWFPADAEMVMNEVSVIDVDGVISRPDRVVLNEDGSVIIVDYKFGRHYPKYDQQVANYADLFRRMGYTDVSTYLWYLDTGDVR